MIWKYEAKKIVRHPMMWSLLGIFLVFNAFLLWTNIGEIGEELQEAHEHILEYGIDEAFYQDSLSKYDTLDMVAIKELKQEMYQYNPTGSYRKFIDRRYEKLNERVLEIVEDGEAEGIVYPGSVYRLHNKLYAKVLRWVFLEIGFLVIFASLFLMDYERMNKTIAVTYIGNVGRKLQWIKWCTGMMIGIGFGIMVLGVTLFAWYRTIPYKDFWNTSVSAALMTEPRGILTYPFITFHKMTILQYLLATIAVGILLVVIIGMIAGVIQMLTNNSYVSFICMVLIFMTGLCITGYSTESWFDIVLSWNPADMWYRIGNWFMEGNLVSNFEGAEMISAAVQAGVWGIFGRLAYQKWMNQDLY